MVWLNALTRHLQPQAIQTREHAQIRAIKESIRHVEVFQMDGVAISNIGRPRPLPGHDTPNPTNNTYTLKCEEPDYADSAIRMACTRQLYIRVGVSLLSPNADFLPPILSVHPTCVLISQVSFPKAA